MEKPMSAESIEMDKNAPLGLTPLTEMQQFVVQFMQNRRHQKGPVSKKKMLTLYGQSKRFEMISEYINQVFVGAALMSKSERFDFIIYLLENYLKSTYGNYETFDEYFERVKDTEENKK